MEVIGCNDYDTQDKNQNKWQQAIQKALAGEDTTMSALAAAYVADAEIRQLHRQVQLLARPLPGATVMQVPSQLLPPLF